MRNMLDVIVVGDLIVDDVIRINALPKPEGVELARDFKRLAGGAANFAIMASRLGLKVKVIDSVGTDEPGKFLVDILLQEGIETSAIKIKKGVTKQTLVIVSSKGEKSFIGLIVEDTATITPEDIEEELIQRASSIYVSGYSIGVRELFPTEGKAVLKSIEVAEQLGKTIFFDPGPLVGLIDEECLYRVIKRSTILSLNLEEASLITHASSLEENIAILHRLGPKLVAIKMGENGCLLSSPGTFYREPGLNVNVVDPTGAGDAFNAAILFGFLKNMPLSLIAKLANAIGALSVTKLGAGQNLPTRSEISSLLSKLGEEHLLLLLEQYWKTLI